MEAQVCPKTWLTESILVTLFCCLPLGIVGIINVSKVSSAFLMGNYDEAVRCSNEAKKYTTISFFVGLTLLILYIIYIFFFAASIAGAAMIQ